MLAKLRPWHLFIGLITSGQGPEESRLVDGTSRRLIRRSIETGSEVYILCWSTTRLQSHFTSELRHIRLFFVLLFQILLPSPSSILDIMKTLVYAGFFSRSCHWALKWNKNENDQFERKKQRCSDIKWFNMPHATLKMHWWEAITGRPPPFYTIE